jgi:hypothetical protein
METKSNKTESHNRPQAEMEAKPQTEQKHPDQWERDLNPNRMAGQNIGERSADREQGLPTAYDVKEVHRALNDQFIDDELKQIPILPEGQRLQQGATYLDLSDAERREFTATGEMAAEPGNRYVPKTEVPYSLWNRLRGVENPERIAERGDAGR